MTERRDDAPDGGLPRAEDAPPALDEIAPEEEDIVEADIEEDIAAPQPTVRDEPPTESAAAAAPTRRPMRPDERRAARQPATPPPPRPSEQRVHINDQASRIFVMASVAVFTLILLNALLLGRGGLAAPIPSPTPVPSASPSPSVSVSPSPSASPSGSASPSPSASPSGSPSPSASPTPSAGSPSPS